MEPNNLKNTVFRVNCSDWIIAEFVGLTSVPYNRTCRPKHFVLINANEVSSEAI